MGILLFALLKNTNLPKLQLTYVPYVGKKTLLLYTMHLDK